MIRKFLTVLYMMLALGANQSLAQDFPKLAVHGAAKPAWPTVTLIDAQDRETSLEAYRGKWVIVNFWATWCGPCREEMPGLDRLQAALPEITVLPIATGRNPVPSITAFYEKAQIVNLPILRDPTSELARAAGVRGLPVTVVLNPDGQEVARMIGDDVWDSPQAIAAIRALAALP